MKDFIRAAGFISMMLASPILAANSNKTPNENLQSGLETVKEGTKEAAEGVGKAAAEVGKNANAVTQKVSRSFKAATCPIVGDRKTKLYYAKDSRSYEEVLDGQKYFEDDDRSCFMTEEAARNGGYTRSAN